MNLAKEPCVACRSDSPRVSEEELTVLLGEIPEWSVVTVKDVPRLKRVIRVEGWDAAVRLTNQIADLAAQTDHHPSILLEWGKVTVQWWTHSIRALHRNDFVMAAKVDEMVSPQ